MEEGIQVIIAKNSLYISLLYHASLATYQLSRLTYHVSLATYIQPYIPLLYIKAGLRTRI